MKTVLFLIMACLVLTPLGASARTLKTSELSYPDAVSNDRMGMLTAGSFSIKPKGFTDLELNVGISNTLKKFERKDEKADDDFPSRVVIWLNYRF